MAPVVTMRQLLESGVHFGHQTRRWNPKMKRFIFTERNGIYIIDLQQSLQFIDRAYEFIKETVAHGGSVLYVGTKKQAQEAIAEQARRVGMPFVNQRWLGGMLTNFSTVYKRLQRLKELEEIDFDDVSASNMTKKELLQLRRERDKLERSLGGIRDMSRVPSAIWVVDTKKEHIAISEARKLGIPVIAILDTNCDPDEVNYPIPGNDDAIRSVALLTRVVADAVADGLIARAGRAVGEEKPQGDGQLGAAEPLAEWERELLEGRTMGGAPESNGTAAAAEATRQAAPAPAGSVADTGTTGTGTAGTGTAGTGTADTGTVGTGTTGTGTTGTGTAGAETADSDAADSGTAGAETASSEAADSGTASAETAGEAASTLTADAETAGDETASTLTADAETAGDETAGDVTADAETAGVETAGDETAVDETASAGRASPATARASAARSRSARRQATSDTGNTEAASDVANTEAAGTDA